MKLPLFLVLAVTALAGCDGNTVPPEKAARQFAADLNLQVDGVTCAQADTDGDGYVSCALSIHGDHARLESIQCARLGAIVAGGCKMTSPKVTQ